MCVGGIGGVVVGDASGGSGGGERSAAAVQFRRAGGQALLCTLVAALSTTLLGPLLSTLLGTSEYVSVCVAVCGVHHVERPLLSRRDTHVTCHGSFRRRVATRTRMPPDAIRSHLGMVPPEIM